MKSFESRIRSHLEFLYGKVESDHLWTRIDEIIREFKHKYPHLAAKVSAPEDRLTEKDSILITYGDQFTAPDNAPLKHLKAFIKDYLEGVISGIHILPFYPYSSDDGFSIIDYYQVNEDLGTWDDFDAIGSDFKLMFDAVINHISQQSDWFKGFIEGEDPYTKYFIVTDPSADLSQVVRPRTLPLLKTVKTKLGEKQVWTTFSEDQIDLNFANPEVLIEIIRLLLFYIKRGARILRLDAIAYLWKEIGTQCIHLPQTHHIVKLFRAIFDTAAPEVIIVTETNVPHAENISYFGEPLKGNEEYDEAQMVYQFPLAPLVLHAFQKGNSNKLMNWVADLETPSKFSTFFNFIASHDGIGVMPARGLLTDEEIQSLEDQALAHGGHVSHKTNPDGSTSVYELNVTLYDLLNDPVDPNGDLDIQRYLASQAIMLSLAGVPGIYVHSLFGSSNCYTCVEETGRARSINREKFTLDELEKKLADPDNRSAKVFSRYVHMLRTRRKSKAFHPNAGQRVIHLKNSIFSILRTSTSKDEYVLVLVNVSDQEQELHIDFKEHNLPRAAQWLDILAENIHESGMETLKVTVAPYQTIWLCAA